MIRNIAVLFSFFLAEALGQNYKLVWSDEFNGTTLDQTKWSFETGNNGGWGNSESEYYTDGTQNCSVQNGLLYITAQKQSYGGYDYTSVRIKTQNKFSFEFGKVEARMKLPYGKGIWPAFWLLGDNISSVGWPSCGENDIMEMIGGSGGTGATGSALSDSTVYGTLHWYQNGNASAGGKYSLGSGKFSDDFHLFGVIWTSNNIQFYVDSTIYFQVNTSPSAMSAFRSRFFIILNIAVGGVWPGYPDSTTVFPQTMQIDYVRIYQDTSDSATGLVIPPGPPKGYSLSQNFPNPFNPSTHISYQLFADSFVTLKIYDLLGREVETLIEGRQHSGDHTVTFDAGNLPGGVYLCWFEAAGYTQVKKMILMK